MSCEWETAYRPAGFSPARVFSARPLQSPPMLFHIVAYGAIALMLFLLFLILFEPGLKYRAEPVQCDLASDQFLCLLGAVSDAQVHQNSKMEVFLGGQQFYEAELQAIRAAQRSIHVERFIRRNRHDHHVHQRKQIGNDL